MTLSMLRRTLGRRPFCTQQQQEGNITRQNFWRSLDSFKTHLHSADFVAIDLELSGIHSVPPSDHFAAYSTPLDRSYRRIKHLAEKFAVLQVGVALFQQDQSCDRFLAHPYNFYVFPRNELSLDLPAATFYCEASALEFLASHGFDFNLCIQDGLSYLSKTQEAEARLRLVNEHVPFKVKKCGCRRSLISTSDVVFSERLRVELEKWHNKIKACDLDWSSLGNDNLDSINIVADISAFKAVNGCQIKDFTVPRSGVFSKRPSFTLQLENHHQVCIAHGVVDTHFKDLVSIVRSDCVSGESHEIRIILTKSKDDLDILKSELEQGCKQAKINEAIGFRHVMDAIVSSRKPLVGHNCALDLAHIHSKFISPLPSATEEFSASLLAHFPCIVDTKYLMKSEPSLRASWTQRHTSLNAVYSHICKPKDIKVGAARFARSTNQLSQKAHIDIMAGFKRYQDTDSRLLHEAGYDAFMTGSVFAQICHQLHVDVKCLQTYSHHKSEASAITEYMNFLNLGYAILDLSTGKQKDTGGESKDLDQHPSSEAQKERTEQLCCAEG